MRIITRRKVKVRVTVHRGDGTIDNLGWQYRKKTPSSDESPAYSDETLVLSDRPEKGEDWKNGRNEGIRAEDEKNHSGISYRHETCTKYCCAHERKAGHCLGTDVTDKSLVAETECNDSYTAYESDYRFKCRGDIDINTKIRKLPKKVAFGRHNARMGEGDKTSSDGSDRTPSSSGDESWRAKYGAIPKRPTRRFSFLNKSPNEPLNESRTRPINLRKNLEPSVVKFSVSPNQTDRSKDVSPRLKRQKKTATSTESNLIAFQQQDLGGSTKKVEVSMYPWGSSGLGTALPKFGTKSKTQEPMNGGNLKVKPENSEGKRAKIFRNIKRSFRSSPNGQRVDVSQRSKLRSYECSPQPKDSPSKSSFSKVEKRLRIRIRKDIDSDTSSDRDEEDKERERGRKIKKINGHSRLKKSQNTTQERIKIMDNNSFTYRNCVSGGDDETTSSQSTDNTPSNHFYRKVKTSSTSELHHVMDTKRGSDGVGQKERVRSRLLVTNYPSGEHLSRDRFRRNKMERCHHKSNQEILTSWRTSFRSAEKENVHLNSDNETKLTSREAEVWTPGGGTDDDQDGPTKIESTDLPSFKDIPPVWTPARAGSASPSMGRKEYNKIKFTGSSTMTKRPSQENSVPRPEESFAWKDKDAEMKLASFSVPTKYPQAPNPTVTLLQKKRDGQIPDHRPEYLQGDEQETFYRPGQKLYTIKREYESEDEEGGGGGGSRKFAVLGPRKADGVGPTTRDGVPIALKSGVKSEHQGEWYRRMFDSLHKVKDEDYIVIKYKSPKARYGGYMSEPDGYDSDIGSCRYLSLDRRNKKFEITGLEPSPKNTKRYIHQPGRIENYVPGFSSLSEKELRDNPEADVKLEIKTGEPPTPAFQKHSGSRMQMSDALKKETGYESDSTLIFRKREDQRRRLDPKSTSVIYRQIQQGGEIPLSGLQKPAPAKPKDSPYKYSDAEVNIHYRTPIRFEQKETLSEEELARRQEEHMKKVYEQERRKKYLAELEDIERRRHTDNFTPLQKSPIPLNRYDDETLAGQFGAKTPEPKQMARALFSFTAQNKRELNFTKGDSVTIRRSIDKNWYEGELRGTVGIFPCNYVEVVPFDSLKTLGRKSSEGQARTRFNFQAQTAMEMSLTKGEMVILTRRVDENWYEGRMGNRRGIFPVTYVDVLMEPGSDRPLSPNRDPMPRPALPAAHLLYNGTSGISSPLSTLGRSGNQTDGRSFNQQLTVNTQQDPIPYRALYNYKPQNDDEVELIEGDIVLVMEKCDDGWFVGTSKRTGLFGTFPGNYVERS